MHLAKLDGAPAGAVALIAARTTFALNTGVWLRRGRLVMVSPVRGHPGRRQAENPLILLSSFPEPPLSFKLIEPTQ